MSMRDERGRQVADCEQQLINRESYLQQGRRQENVQGATEKARPKNSTIKPPFTLSVLCKKKQGAVAPLPPLPTPITNSTSQPFHGLQYGPKRIIFQNALQSTFWFLVLDKCIALDNYYCCLR